jgi:hypothetical protein
MDDGQARSVRRLHAEVEARLARPVSIHSVNWRLSIGARHKPARFQRVRRGVYRQPPG